MNANHSTPEIPQTIEGYYVLHDTYAIDWARWHGLQPAQRQAMTQPFIATLKRICSAEDGDSAAYNVVTQKGDLMFVHYRRTCEDLNEVERTLRHTELYGYLKPQSSFLSVIEIGLYELSAMTINKLNELGIHPGKPGFDEAFEEEMEGQHERIEPRLFRSIPEQKHICFYPMNKRRGEAVNWYALSLDKRREMMRGHGRVGHKYHDKVTQVVGGAVALDDWEWGVSLHSDDPLVFKKLVYEMRFDPASALYAEFGPFTIGIRTEPKDVEKLLDVDN